MSVKKFYMVKPEQRPDVDANDPFAYVPPVPIYRVNFYQELELCATAPNEDKARELLKILNS